MNIGLKDILLVYHKPSPTSYLETMMNEIILAEDFNVTNITYGEPRVLDSGGRSIPVYYAGRPLQVQMPEMSAPFGLGQWPKEAVEGMPVKYDISLSFRDLDRRETLKAAYKMFTDLDTAIIDNGLNNSFAFFKKKHTNKEVVQALFTPTIKLPKDRETGEVTDKYPATINFKLPMRDNTFQFLCFNKQQEQIDLRSVQLKGSKAMVIIQCSGIWIANGKFGCSWKVKQMQVSPPSTITGYAFKQVATEDLGDLDDDVVPASVAAPVFAVASSAAAAPTASAVAASTAMIEESEEEKEDDDEEEEDEEPVVVPVKKSASKKVSKK